MKTSIIGIAALGLLLGGCASTTAYSAPEAELTFRTQQETRSVSNHDWSAPSEMSFDFAADQEPSETEADIDAIGAPAHKMGAPTRASRGHSLDSVTKARAQTLN